MTYTYYRTSTSATLDYSNNLDRTASTISSSDTIWCVSPISINSVRYEDDIDDNSECLDEFLDGFKKGEEVYPLEVGDGEVYPLEVEEDETKKHA